jgi:penicillin-binding protein-related factor A (putative recombinase)
MFLYQILNKKIVLFVLIEFSQGIKTFLVHLKALLEKLFQTFYYSLKELF